MKSLSESLFDKNLVKKDLPLLTAYDISAVNVSFSVEEWLDKYFMIDKFSKKFNIDNSNSKFNTYVPGVRAIISYINDYLPTKYYNLSDLEKEIKKIKKVLDQYIDKDHEGDFFMRVRHINNNEFTIGFGYVSNIHSMPIRYEIMILYKKK